MLDHDCLFDSNQLRVKIQGVDKLYVVKRLLPRRRGNFLIEIIARDNEQVMIVAEHTILGLVLNKTLEVELGAAETQAKEIMAEILRLYLGMQCRKTTRPQNGSRFERRLSLTRPRD